MSSSQPQAPVMVPGPTGLGEASAPLVDQSQMPLTQFVVQGGLMGQGVIAPGQQIYQMNPNLAGLQMTGVPMGAQSSQMGYPVLTTWPMTTSQTSSQPPGVGIPAGSVQQPLMMFAPQAYPFAQVPGQIPQIQVPVTSLTSATNMHHLPQPSPQVAQSQPQLPPPLHITQVLQQPLLQSPPPPPPPKAQPGKAKQRPKSLEHPANACGPEPRHHFMPTLQEAVAKNQSSVPFDAPSAKGIFGWTSVDSRSVPYILRETKKYVSVKMVEQKLLASFPSTYPQELEDRPPLRSLYITSHEAKLFNEINTVHCNMEYGKENFTTQDLVVELGDFEEFYSIVKKYFPTSDKAVTVAVHVSSGSSPTTVSATSSPGTSRPPPSVSPIQGGWLQVNNTVVPYILRKGMQLVPLSVIRYGAGLLKDMHVEGVDAGAAACEYFTRACNSVGLKFEFTTTGSRKTRLLELHLVAALCEGRVYISELPKEDPFGHAEFKELPGEVSPTSTSPRQHRLGLSPTPGSFQVLPTGAVPLSGQPSASMCVPLSYPPTNHNSTPRFMMQNPASMGMPTQQYRPLIMPDGSGAMIPHGPPPPIMQHPQHQPHSNGLPPPEAVQHNPNFLPHQQTPSAPRGPRRRAPKGLPRNPFPKSQPILYTPRLQGPSGPSIDASTPMDAQWRGPIPPMSLQPPPSALGVSCHQRDLSLPSVKQTTGVSSQPSPGALHSSASAQVSPASSQASQPEDTIVTRHRRKAGSAKRKQYMQCRSMPVMDVPVSTPPKVASPPLIQTPNHSIKAGIPFNGRTVTCLIRKGSMINLALVEAICRVYFPNSELKEFIHVLEHVLALPMENLSMDEEKSFIAFYNLPTSSLECNKVIDLRDLERHMPQLTFLFKTKRHDEKQVEGNPRMEAGKKTSPIDKLIAMDGNLYTEEKQDNNNKETVCQIDFPHGEKRKAEEDVMSPNEVKTNRRKSKPHRLEDALSRIMTRKEQADVQPVIDTPVEQIPTDITGDELRDVKFNIPRLDEINPTASHDVITLE